jgi:hypothetical protein
MKKRNFKSLDLHKKVVSNLYIISLKGGLRKASSDTLDQATCFFTDATCDDRI